MPALPDFIRQGTAMGQFAQEPLERTAKREDSENAFVDVGFHPVHRKTFTTLPSIIEQNPEARFQPQDYLPQARADVKDDGDGQQNEGCTQHPGSNTQRQH